MTNPLLHFQTLTFTILLLLLVAAGDHPEEDTSTPITRFQNYLRINTAHPNPDYTPAVAYLTSIAKALNLRIQTLHFTPSKSKPLLLLTWPGSHPSLPSILLNSHLDSIPAEPDKWVHPPFSAHRTPEGHIFARGAQDDKCIAIQYLEAIRKLKAANFTPIRTVHISYVPDEEIGGSDGASKFAASKEFKDLNVGFMLDEGQANPGDEFRVFYADRTPWNLIVKAKGTPGHGASMYDHTAMENLMKSVEVMSRFREAQFDVVKAGKASLAEVISVNPVYLKSGTASPDGFVMNMQPSEAEAGFNIRIPPTVDPELVRKRISKEWAPESRNLTFQLTESGPTRDYMGRPLVTPTDDSNPWWSVFKQAVAAAGGKLRRPEILASTTDARFMRQQGIPTLGFSPMSNTPILLHEHNEFLKDAIFLKGIQVYESVISALSSFEESHPQYQ